MMHTNAILAALSLLSLSSVVQAELSLKSSRHRSLAKRLPQQPDNLAQGSADTAAGCTAWSTPQAGDSCYSIIAGKMDLDAFYAANPSIDNACQNLQVGVAYCTAIGSTPAAAAVKKPVKVAAAAVVVPTQQEDVPAAPARAVKSAAKKAPAVVTSSSSSGSKRGLAWAIDNSLVDTIAPSGSKIGWYFHWQDGTVPGIPGNVDYMPNLWGLGGDKIAAFKSVMASLGGNLPKQIMSFNEPDIPGQANLGPAQAAAGHRQYLQPYAEQGVRVGAPAIAFNVDWLQSFMNECRGCDISFLNVHWYGNYTNLAGFKGLVEKVHNTFPDLPIVIGEWSVTASGGGNADQILAFAKESTAWLDGLDYVEKYAWFGAWISNPDGYANSNGRMVDDSGKLTALGNWWVHG